MIVAEHPAILTCQFLSKNCLAEKGVEGNAQRFAKARDHIEVRARLSYFPVADVVFAGVKDTRQFRLVDTLFEACSPNDRTILLAVEISELGSFSLRQAGDVSRRKRIISGLHAFCLLLDFHVHSSTKIYGCK